MEQENLQELRKFVSPECVLGPGARLLASNYAINFGSSKVLVVTDSGVIGAGWTKSVTDELDKANLPYIIYDHITSNPRAQEAMDGAYLYLAEKCNCIIAVGGGSPIDCAKAIGIVSTNGGDIVNYEGVDNVRAPIPPLICVPTTGGSSADVSQFAIINDMKRKTKLAIISKTIVPDVSLIDPVPLTTMPSELSAITGIDALTHSFEAYVSNAHSSFTDLFAIEAIKLISTYLPMTINDPMNVELRSSITIACMYAGLAFSNAGLGLVHAMAHSLGGCLDIPHGETNALLLRHVVAFNFCAAADRYRSIAQAMGMDVAGTGDESVKAALLARLEQFERSIDMPVASCTVKIDKQRIADFAQNALDDPDIATNPREPSLSDIEAIYEQAL